MKFETVVRKWDIVSRSSILMWTKKKESSGARRDPGREEKRYANENN